MRHQRGRVQHLQHAALDRQLATHETTLGIGCDGHVGNMQRDDLVHQHAQHQVAVAHHARPRRGFAAVDRAEQAADVSHRQQPIAPVAQAARG